MALEQTIPDRDEFLTAGESLPRIIFSATSLPNVRSPKMFYGQVLCIHPHQIGPHVGRLFNLPIGGVCHGCHRVHLFHSLLLG
jgi:hypothetical protein